MREIKMGDEVVRIDPECVRKGMVLKITELEPYIPGSSRCDDGKWQLRETICHAPDPNYEYKVGDWVLPVVLNTEYICGGNRKHREGLLKPVMVIDGGEYFECEGGLQWYSHEVVPITRTADGYDINGTFLSAEEFHRRYGVEIPVEDDLNEFRFWNGDEWECQDYINGFTPGERYTIQGGEGDCSIGGTPTIYMRSEKGTTCCVSPVFLQKHFRKVEPKSTSQPERPHPVAHNYQRPTVNTPPRVADDAKVTVDRWPTQQDVEECCGVWAAGALVTWIRYDPGKGMYSTAVDDLKFESREHFNSEMIDFGFKRIESIGTRIMPEKREYDPYGLTDEQRKRWERRTEWD